MTKKTDLSRKLEARGSSKGVQLHFIRNEGQLDPRVKYYARSSGQTVYFTEQGIYLTLRSVLNGDDKKPSIDLRNAGRIERLKRRTNKSIHQQTIRLYPLNARKNYGITAEGLQQTQFNYFLGSDPSRWRTKIQAYSAVLYRDVYPGIDLRFYGNGRDLEYDVLLKPGADPSRIKFAYEGVRRINLDHNGNMVVDLARGKIIQRKPRIRQAADARQIHLNGAFTIFRIPKKGTTNFAYGFSLERYDKHQAVTIDPQIDYSTYLGGGQSDFAGDVVVDSSGYAYVCGATNSTDFPATLGAFDTTFSGGDGFVSKFSQDGTQLVYSTFLGGSDSDYCISMAIDSTGAAYLAGTTVSTDFPTVNPFQPGSGGGRDATVSKLSADGSTLLYSTYLGGSNVEYGSAIAIDQSNDAYVVGNTSSVDFPVINALQPIYGGGLYDAYVAELNQQGNDLIYSTYLGGPGLDQAAAVAVNATGTAYVTGTTDSTNFPITAGAIQTVYAGSNDGFVSKIAPGGSSLEYSTYLGGANPDDGFGIAIDDDGNAYITGDTFSIDFPLVNPIQSTLGCCGDSNAFISKFTPDGTSLVYSTFLGGSAAESGSPSDTGNAIAVDANRAAYVVGFTYSTDFPTVDPLPVDCRLDAFVTKINPQGNAWVYSTCLGGTWQDEGFGIAVDSAGSAYVTGFTYSPDFPVRNALLPNYLGNIDGFVTRLDCDSVDDPRVFENSPSADFTVHLCSSRAVDASVDYATSDGTATAGVDYVATSGTRTIPAGSTEATIPVPLISNNLAGGEKTFYLKLSNAVNLDLRGYSTATILGGLLLDDFGDSTLDWTTEGSWTEGGGALQGSASRSATAFAPLPWSPSGASGCTVCAIETDIQTSGGLHNRIFLDGWFLDNSNKVELTMAQEKGKWVLKQRSGAVVVAKARGTLPVIPGVSYHVKLAFDGTVFTLFVDGMIVLSMNAGAPPASGNVGFKVKKTAGTFGPIRVY